MKENPEPRRSYIRGSALDKEIRSKIFWRRHYEKSEEKDLERTCGRIGRLCLHLSTFGSESTGTEKKLNTLETCRPS
jgi:hypothetical protein